MSKKLRKTIGGLLIASPFVGVIIFGIMNVGIVKTLEGIGFIILLITVISVGAYLIEGSDD